MRRRDFTKRLILSAAGSAVLPRMGSASSEPVTNAGNPRCWLVASDLQAGGLAGGAPVTSWLDRTANHYNLQQQSVIPDINGVWDHSPPTLTINAVGGLPAVSLNAANSETLMWVPGGALDQGVSGFTAVFVCRPNASALSSSGFLFLTHDAVQASRLAIIFDPPGTSGSGLASHQFGVRFIVRTQNEYAGWAGGEDGGGTNLLFSSTSGSAIWGVLIFRVDYTGTNQPNIAVNGGTPLSAPALTYPSPYTTVTPSYMDVIGSDSEAGYLTCDIAEAAFYASYLSNIAASGLVAGLRQKYSF